MTAGIFGANISLSALFARNAASRPNAPALADSGGSKYSYAEAFAASESIAAQIAAMGLPANSSIVLVLPNSNELVLSLLAILRAGHLPVPMPVAWRKSDLVRACREAEAAALITTAHYSAENLPQLAAEVAIEAFELSFPCAFGSPLPDGILPLTISTCGVDKADVVPAKSTSSVGIGTMQAESGGVSLVLHRDCEMLAAGFGAMLAADMQGGDEIISAVSMASLAGLSTTLVPWLLSGGALTLRADAARIEVPAGARKHLVASAGALWPLRAQLPFDLVSATAVHFAGVHPNANFVALNAGRVVDAYALQEFCLISAARSEPGEPAPIPLGSIHAGNASGSGPAIVATKLDEQGNIFIHGAMAPADRIGSQDWLDIGVRAEPAGRHAFLPVRSDDMIAIGSLRFSFAELERRILSAALVYGVQIVEDRILGHRLVIESDRPDQTSAALLSAGLPRIVARAVRKGDAVRARA